LRGLFARMGGNEVGDGSIEKDLKIVEMRSRGEK
jgi:hypothetical protein